jgi:hypothetical protein
MHRNADGTSRRVAALVAAGRVALGMGGLLAPATVHRVLFGGRRASPDGVLLLRMTGVRDLALGLGVLLALGRDPAAARGWVAAGALADAVDAPAMATSGALRPSLRPLSALAASSGAVAGAWLARRLG